MCIFINKKFLKIFEFFFLKIISIKTFIFQSKKTGFLKFSTTVLVSRLHTREDGAFVDRREDEDLPPSPRLDRMHTATQNFNSLAPFWIIIIKLNLRLARKLQNLAI